MIKISNKFKKPYFWVTFDLFMSFLSRGNAHHHMGPLHHAEFQKKLVGQFQEIFRTEKRTENKRKDGRTDPNS